MTRVALYAEGTGDASGLVPTWAEAPGDELPEDALGAAHFLVRKAIARARGGPEASVKFLVPQRKPTGLVPQGSDLLRASTLRSLLTWPRKDRRPDLCVVLVDNDGDDDRAKALATAMAPPMGTQPSVFGVAVQEFESWLLADMGAVRAVLGVVDEGPAVESLPRRGARERLAELCGRKVADPASHKALRIAIAKAADAGEIERRAPSFSQFAGRLS